MEENLAIYGYVKMEAEIGVTLSQAKECQEPPEAGKSKEGCSSRAFKGSMALLRP